MKDSLGDSAQTGAMKVRTRWLLGLVTCALLLVVVTLLMLFGMAWRIELDVHSGRDRHVTLLMGLSIITSEPRETEFSDWLGVPIGEPKWIEVAGDKLDPLGEDCVLWCYDSILR